MADDAIGSTEIIDNSITTGDIKSTGNTKVLTTDGTGVVSWIDQSALAKTIAVDNSTVGLNASNQLEVKALGVGTSQLAASAVTSAKISDGAVDTVDIRAGQNTSVLTTNSAGKVIWIKQSELAKTIAVDNSTVGLNASNQLEVKTSGIGTTQLAAGAVTTAKIEALASGQFIIGTNGTTAGNTKVTMTGDVSMSNTGATTIGNNKVTTAAIADNNVTLAKIADGTAINQFITTPLSGTTFDPQWTSKASISLSGFGAAAADISLGGFKITDLATPASATDAVTKKYVDDIIPTTAFTKYNVPYWDGAKYANSTIWCSGDSLIVGTKTAPANAAAFNYNFEVKGTLKTDKIFHRSDSVFKKNVHTLGSALDHVKAMRGVSYEWKRAENPTENFAKGTQIGLIAQEVERVYPELVTTDNGGHKSVEYANLVAVLIEAIKEQQKLIEKQNAEIAALKLDNQKSQTELSKVADMQKQMADMQKQMASLVSAMQLYMPSAQVTK